MHRCAVAPVYRPTLQSSPAVKRGIWMYSGQDLQEPKAVVSTQSTGDMETILFSQNADYRDVVPVPQDDGPHPVCPIAYSPAYVDAMNYLRAFMKAKELSTRALDVTTRAIELSSANYTVWYYRRLILDHLKTDLSPELEFVSELARDHPKNYQVWYHRMWIVQQIQNPVHELSFTAEILETDSKNYHAWSHRQWVLKTFGLWTNELEYVEDLLQKDIRNNSAWNQRYFVIFHTTGYTPEVIDQEIDYTITRVMRSPSNESSWNYLLGYKGK
eukprot:TRINITY_DN6774_c0_g1_i9.p1 TRINITY_DN6774_c0_g1~~TRINITY_DN6774_c0_g1_i9.p1  ORF type:complete len:272 (-),score=34.37 TRINITY_DN6774_c0_g1_i9:375-1190(-)